MRRPADLLILIALLSGGFSSTSVMEAVQAQSTADPSVTVASFDGADAAHRARVLNAMASRRLSASPAEVARIIRAGLNDSDPSVRLSALSAAASRAAGPRLSNQPDIKDTWALERETLQAMRPLITGALQDSSPQLRRAALLALGNIALSESAGSGRPNSLDNETVSAFSRTFHSDSDGRVRGEIAKTFALVDNDTPEVRAVVERSLDDERPGVRQYGAMGVGRLKMVSALPRLVGRLSDGEQSVRGAAAAALTRFGPELREHKAAVARAQQSEPSQQIRAELQRTLDRIGP